MSNLHKHNSITEDSNHNKIKYFPPNSVQLNLPFILTQDKKLTIGMPYLKLEGRHIDAIRLLDIWDTDGYIFLKIENLQHGQVNTLSWALNHKGDFWVWSIASFSFLTTITSKRNNTY